MKKKKWIITGCLLVLCAKLTQAQEAKIWDISIEQNKSFIVQHDLQLDHLIRSHPIGFSINVKRQTYGSKPWHQVYNYPQLGYSLKYFDFKNEIIGKSIALIPHFSFTVFRPTRGKLQLRAGYGVAYNTNPYDQKTNNKNTVIGTRFAYAFQLASEYQFNFNNRVHATAGLSLDHISNAATKKPNKGVNLVTSSIGFGYVLSNATPEFQKHPAVPQKGLGFFATTSFGLNQHQIEKSGPHPFYIAQLGAEYQFNQVSSILVGTEAFWSLAIKEQIDNPTDINDQGDVDYRRLGISVGHELYIGSISLAIQLGYYYYQPYKSSKPLYQRYSIRYYFSRNFFGAYCIKTHGGVAEAAEFSVGYKIFK